MPNDTPQNPHDLPDMPEIWSYVTHDVLPLTTKTIHIHPEHPQTHLGEIKRAVRRKREQEACFMSSPHNTHVPLHHNHTCLLDNRLKKRIAKGKEKIDASFDLHGMTLATAHTQLQHFLQNAYHMRLRTLLIITGKGKDGEGILRKTVPLWLDHAARQHIVQNYDTATTIHGGDGAFYVRLRQLNPIVGGTDELF